MNGARRAAAKQRYADKRSEAEFIAWPFGIIEFIAQPFVINELRSSGAQMNGAKEKGSPSM